MAKSTKPRPLSRVTPADYIRLGPDVAKIKSQMTPARWRSVVKTAHAQGWTVASALDSSTPAALKQKTQTSLRSAAARGELSASHLGASRGYPAGALRTFRK